MKKDKADELLEGQLSIFDVLDDFRPKKKNCAATNEVCNFEECKKVARDCLGIDCNAKCCQACTKLCGARCNYSAHQPKKLNTETKEWVEVPNVSRNCEHCKRFNPNIEQPPKGWGMLGWCHTHNQKVHAISYCQEFEMRADK